MKDHHTNAVAYQCLTWVTWMCLMV